MNLLAHLHLGKDLSPIESAGNLTADFCRQEGPPEFQRGVRFHRAIDAFTDGHTAFVEARAIFSGEQRRFGGVLSDFAFDLCLSRTWSEWGVPTPQRDFIDERLGHIIRFSGGLPTASAVVVQRMANERWLHRYGETEGIRSAITRLAVRRPVASRMLGAERFIEERYEEFVQIFRSFYPQALAYARRVRPPIQISRRSVSPRRVD